MADDGVIYKDLGLNDLLAKLNVLDHTKVRTGVVGPEADKPASSGRMSIAEVAYILQMGSRNVPIEARPFIEIDPQIAKEEAEKILKVIFSFGNVDAALHAAGERFAEHMRDKVLNPTTFAPNMPSTIAKKGFDHPLMDTSALLGAIGHELVREGGDRVAGPAGSEYEQFEVSGG